MMEQSWIHWRMHEHERIDDTVARELGTLPAMIGILMLFLFFWQLKVLPGEEVKNKEGSVDLWHEK